MPNNSPFGDGAVPPARGVTYAILLLVAALWGLGLPMMQRVVRDVGPDKANFWRFGCGALCVLPLARKNLRDVAMARAGILLGCFSAALYACLSRAVQLMPTARCSFWLGTSVVWVPLFAAAVFRHPLSRRDSSAAACCLLGLLTLCGFDVGSVQRGELFALGAALCFASAVVTLHAATTRPKAKPTTLIFFELTTVSLLSAPTALASAPAHLSPAGIGALMYCAGIGTVSASLLQMHFQRHASAPAAAIIYALKPVFTCIFALLFFGEAMTPQTIRGGALILLASLLPHLPRGVLWQPRA